MKDRIQKILSKEGIAPTRFAEIIGVQRSSISHILSGRNKPSFDVIQRMLEKFPKINPDWLLLGKGDMYRKVVQTTLFSQDLQAMRSNDQTQQKELTFDQHTIKSSPELKGSENRIFEKQVERVIVFYKDKTFTEYIPNLDK